MTTTVPQPKPRRRRMNRVVLDDMSYELSHPVLGLSATLHRAGFPLKIEASELDQWQKDERFRDDKIRAAAREIGATWWAVWNNVEGRRLFEWGDTVTE